MAWASRGREQVARALEARRRPVVRGREEVRDAQLCPLRRGAEDGVDLRLGGQEGAAPEAGLVRAHLDAVREGHHRVGAERLLDGEMPRPRSGSSSAAMSSAIENRAPGLPQPVAQRDALAWGSSGAPDGAEPSGQGADEPRGPVAGTGQHGEAPVQLQDRGQLHVASQVEGEGEDAGAVCGEEELQPGRRGEPHPGHARAQVHVERTEPAADPLAGGVQVGPLHRSLLTVGEEEAVEVAGHLEPVAVELSRGLAGPEPAGEAGRGTGQRLGRPVGGAPLEEEGQEQARLGGHRARELRGDRRCGGVVHESPPRRGHVSGPERAVASLAPDITRRVILAPPIREHSPGRGLSLPPPEALGFRPAGS